MTDGATTPSVLAGECALVSRRALELETGDFARPTRCPPWDVRVLLGHMWRDVDRILVYLSEPPPSSADTDAVTYWRAYDPKQDGPEISHRAQEAADAFSGGPELARAFDARWREAVAEAERAGPERLVTTWGPAMRLDEYLGTRVLEMAVHGLDLSDALGRAPWITSGATRVVRAILVGLLGAQPPAELGWSDVTFIETGTGRTAPTSDERATLGPLAGAFPLLG